MSIVKLVHDYFDATRKIASENQANKWSLMPASRFSLHIALANAICTDDPIEAEDIDLPFY